MNTVCLLLLLFVSPLLLPASARCPVHTTDRNRANSQVPSSSLSARTPHGIASKINAHVRKTAGVHVRDCADHSIAELNATLERLRFHQSDELAKIYGKDSLRALPEAYDAAGELDEIARGVLRDAMCAQALMMWAHHIPECGKAALRSSDKVCFLF